MLEVLLDAGYSRFRPLLLRSLEHVCLSGVRRLAVTLVIAAFRVPVVHDVFLLLSQAGRVGCLGGLELGRRYDVEWFILSRHCLSVASVDALDLFRIERSLGNS